MSVAIGAPRSCALDVEASAAGARVSFRDVEKRYGQTTALHPTSFEVEAGEFFAILGPSGSGKSTLLGIAAGFVPPTGGHVLVNGVDLVGVPPYRRNVGMVFQNYSLFPHMTVAENIAFPLRMRRMAKTEIAARVGRILEMVRLSGYEARKPTQLSGGQQQRVALARAAVYDPVLLLMDEPLGALDKNLREEMQDEIKRFQAALGTTVIYVTHDQQEAACMADRIAIMRAGRIVQTGTPRELYESPADLFVAGFLGEANILPVAGIEGEAGGRIVVRTSGGLRVQATGPRPNGSASVLCVRPESIALADGAEGQDNRYPAAVAEVVYTAGSVRYRVRLEDGTVLTVRMPPRHGIRLHQVNDRITVGWRAADTIVVPES